MRLSLELIERAGAHPHSQRCAGVRRETGIIRGGRLEQVHEPTLSFPAGAAALRDPLRQAFGRLLTRL